MTMPINLDEVRKWISLIHLTSEGLIWVGSTDNMSGYTSSDIDGAVNNVQTLERSKPKGIYLRTTSLSRVPIDATGDGSSRRSRGSEADSYILPGFAADLDIAGPGHATTKVLPPDETAAMRIVETSGLPIPTVWVHSGGGLYPWWLLEDPQDLRDEATRIRAKDISVKIQRILVHAGKELGWFVGGEVGDLARILRIPGTVNRKEGLERPCLVLETSYEYYDYAELFDKVNALIAALPTPELPKYTHAPRALDASRSDLSPLEDFELQTGWDEILANHFDFVEQRGRTSYWLRRGSESGARWNATTGHAADRDRFYSFSPLSEFEANVPYNKQAVFTLLNFGGLTKDHFSRATRHLRDRGYGGELPALHKTLDPAGLIRPAGQVAVAEQAVDHQEPEKAALVVQANQSLPVLDHDGLPSSVSSVFSQFKWRDTGLTDMYVKAFEPVFRYIRARDEWMIWDGSRWTRDDLGRHEYATIRLLQEMESYAEEVNRTNPEVGKNLVEAAKKAATLQKMRSLHNAAKSYPALAAAEDSFDSADNSHLVTVNNGTLNILTGKLQDFDPSLMLTKKMGVTYAPGTEGARFRKFITDVMPDEQVRNYVKRAIAATLLGRADERIIMMLYGESGSGKSAFLELMVSVFGDYASVADEGTFKPVPDGYQGPTDKLHKLRGARLAKMSEMAQGTTLNESLIKNVTGQDTQSTRPLYGHLSEWKVQYVAWMATNHLPRLSSNDGAIWNRVKPICFPGRFIDDKGQVLRAEDRDLGRKIAKEEGSAVLDWILEGIQEYLSGGLAEPEVVGQWLNAYRDETDTTRQFVAEAQDTGQLAVAEGQQVGVRELYKVYTAWCADNQIRPVASNSFTGRMLANGWVKEKREKGIMWQGIGIVGMIGAAQTPSSGSQWMGRPRN